MKWSNITPNISWSKVLQSLFILLTIDIITSSAMSLDSSKTSSNSRRHWRRRLLKGARNTNRNTRSNTQAYLEEVTTGKRNCTDYEKSQAQCLEGECVAFRSSSMHSFVYCSCPAGKTGVRCEMVKIDPTVMTNISGTLIEIESSELCHGQNIQEVAKIYDKDIIKKCVQNYTARDLRRLKRKNTLTARELVIVDRQIERLRRQKLKDKKRLRNIKKKSDKNIKMNDPTASHLDVSELLSIDNAVGDDSGSVTTYRHDSYKRLRRSLTSLKFNL